MVDSNFYIKLPKYEEVLLIYFFVKLCKESHELWRNNLTKLNTMWMDYNQINVNIWVVTGGILQLFIRKKIFKKMCLFGSI
jgi:hypothetical protein